MHLLLNGDIDTLLGYVDTIQKLSDILLAAASGLCDACTGKGNLGNINSGDLDLILNIGSLHVLDTLKKLNTSNSLLTQEITDLHGLLTGVVDAGAVDGEMSVTETHLVLESLGDTTDHVLDVRADSSKRSRVLTVSEPDVDLQGLGTVILDRGDVKRHVLERSGKGTEGASDGDLSGLGDHGD